MPQDRTFGELAHVDRGWRLAPLLVALTLFVGAGVAFAFWVNNTSSNVQRLWQMALTAACTLLGFVALALAKR